MVNAARAADDFLKNDALRDYFVWWDKISGDDIVKLEEVLNKATREEDIQQFLKQNPKFLIQHLGGGHGRWVIPKQKLGVQHVTDFLIAEKNSMGYEWCAVELESPQNPMFNKNGDPSRYLNHAIRQIQDWRVWLTKNIGYASLEKSKSGLGLTDVDGNIHGLILIDRNSSDLSQASERRRQMVKDLNIRIHTYDFLLQSLKGRLEGLAFWAKELFEDET